MEGSEAGSQKSEGRSEKRFIVAVEKFVYFFQPVQSNSGLAIIEVTAQEQIASTLLD
jgi:hypothetical protein